MNPLFKKILASPEPAPAYLLVGTDEEGLQKAASLLAQGWFCEKREACQTCPPCRRFQEGSLTDFLLLRPEKGTIRIDQVRELLRQLSFKPVGGRSILLIEEAESLTEGAANSLLKTIEEPPPSAIFLLTSLIPDRIPSTIRSRCQRVILPLIERDPKRRFEPILPFLKKELLPTLLTRPRTFDAASRLAEKSLQEVEEPEELLKLLKAWWRDLILYKETKDVRTLFVGEPAELEPFLRDRSPEQLFEGWDQILETGRAIEANVLKQLALERLFFKLM